MKITGAKLTWVRVPLKEPFRISSGAVSEKDAIVVRLETDEGIGYGESSPMSGSFYSSDTPESCWQELRERIIPAAIAGQPLEGSKFAITGVETAMWDVRSRRSGTPLCELLGGACKPVESGLAVGLYDDTADLLRAIEHHLREGYKRVKVKIERGRDIELIRAVRGSFGDIPLFVDANGAYDLSDIEVFRALDDYGLMMFEQPFPGHMLAELAELQRQVRTPICLDESLETADDLRRAIELGSFRIANIKIQRVGGFANALEIHRICVENNIPVWMGTMPELGIGSVQAIAMATLSGCVFPTDVESSLRWFTDDIVDPLIEVRDGYLKPCGFEVNEAKLKQYMVASETL